MLGSFKMFFKGNLLQWNGLKGWDDSKDVFAIYLQESQLKSYALKDFSTNSAKPQLGQ